MNVGVPDLFSSGTQTLELLFLSDRWFYIVFLFVQTTKQSNNSISLEIAEVTTAHILPWSELRLDSKRTSKQLEHIQMHGLI